MFRSIILKHLYIVYFNASEIFDAVVEMYF